MQAQGSTALSGFELTNLNFVASRALRMLTMEPAELPAGPASPGDASEVVRMMYASEANVHTSVYTEMERIRASAVRNNTPEGVYTALLYQSGWFLQWKEGPGPALLRIMDRVVMDPRHHSLRLVHSSRGQRLLSGPWSMAIVLHNEQPTESRWAQMHSEIGHGISTCVAQLLRDMEQGVQYAPPAIWRRLSMPVRSPLTLDISERTLQSILVCAASGRQPFELVAWLSSKYDQEVVHRRYADAQHFDVGTDYVDCPKPGGVLRVISMARNGLAVPLTRALMADHSHLVLLLDRNPGPNRRLMDRVSEALAGLPTPPALLGAAESAGTHEEMSALAGDWGIPYLGARLPSNQDNAALWNVIEPHLARWERPQTDWPIEPLFPNGQITPRGFDTSAPAPLDGNAGCG